MNLDLRPLAAAMMSSGLMLGMPLAGASPCSPCAPRSKGRLHLAQNPCAAKNPCAARNPCAAKNPCAARNPCAAKDPCAAKNPCAAAKDPAAERAFKQYSKWKKVNTKPVKSATHGNTLVITYVNQQAEGAATCGKFPFGAGSMLMKEAFDDQGGKPGAKSSVFLMEKRKKGYDAANGDWHYAVLDPKGAVQMTGSGKAGASTQFCSQCHQAAKANDYVFGNGTTMKVKPTTLGAAANPCAANPCAAKNPCAARNPCAAKNPCAANPCAAKRR
ncbi:MAG: cytochrome P460 family protein [Betaproteobacteria bacterium]